MSYRKEYIIDGGCQESREPHFRTISVHLNDFTAKPSYRITISCDKCEHYIECTFKQKPCRVIKKIQANFASKQKLVSQNELKVLATYSNFNKVIDFIKSNTWAIAHKTK